MIPYPLQRVLYHAVGEVQIVIRRIRYETEEATSPFLRTFERVFCWVQKPVSGVIHLYEVSQLFLGLQNSSGHVSFTNGLVGNVKL